MVIMVRNTQRAVVVCSHFLRRQVRGIMAHTNALHYDIGICLTGDRRMKQLNKEFRGVARTTDVISVPVTQVDPGCLPPPIFGRFYDIGSIYLSVPYIQRAVLAGELELSAAAGFSVDSALHRSSHAIVTGVNSKATATTTAVAASGVLAVSRKDENATEKMEKTVENVEEEEKEEEEDLVVPGLAGVRLRSDVPPTSNMCTSTPLVHADNLHQALTRTIVHGYAHLMGYTHDTDSDWRTMVDFEEELIETLIRKQAD